MQLKSLRLKDIKNHKNLKVNFTEGITAILGKNGTGKTTILESIGFVLFDYLPYSQKEFITTGKTWGEIELSVEMEKDTWVVLISRRIGNNPHYKITTGINGDIIGKEDVQAWIRDNLNISDDMELSKLFSEIIAIPQGLATAHFLLSPTQRAEIFNSILGVDIYRDCYKKLQPVEKMCNEMIGTMDNRVTILEQEVEEYDEVKDKLKDLDKEIEILSLELTNTNSELDSKDKELDKLNEMERLLSQKEFFTGRVVELEGSIESKRLIIKDLNIDDNKIDVLENKLSDLSDKRDELYKTKDNIVKVIHECDDLSEDITELDNTINEFDTEMKDYDRVSKLAIKFDNAKSKMDSTKNYITVLDSELSKLQSSDGTCPITLEKCDKITISELTERIIEHEDRLLTANKLLSRLNEAYNECYRAKQIKDGLDDKREHIQRIRAILTKDKEIINKKQKELGILTETEIRLSNELKDYNVTRDELDKAKETKETIRNNLSYIEEESLKLDEIKQQLQEIQNKTSGYEKERHRLTQERVQELSDSVVRLEEKCSYKRQERALNQSTMEELEVKGRKLTELQKDYKKYKDTLDRIKKIRGVFNKIGSELAETYLQNISYDANLIFQELMNSDESLVWDKTYNIIVGDKSFLQLSGGQQMCASIAVRLALLKYFSDVKILILDEPTANLDSDKRESLAESIRNLQGYNQILVVSHDDSFETITDNIINLGSN